MGKNICLGKAQPIWQDKRYKGFTFGVVYPEKRVKHIRMKCELCGRRLLSSVQIVDNFLVHSIPAHKPKHWWKKGKRNVATT